MLSIPQVANLLSVSYWTIRRMILSGQLKGIKVGGSWRVEEHELESYKRKARPH